MTPTQDKNMTLQGECTTTVQQFRAFLDRPDTGLNPSEKECLLSILDISFKPTDTLELLRSRRDVLTKLFRETHPTYCRTNDALFFESLHKGFHAYVKEHTSFRFLGEMEEFYSSFSENNFPTLFADIHSFMRSSRLITTRLISHYSKGTPVHIPFKDYLSEDLFAKFMVVGLKNKTAQNYASNASRAILFFMDNFEEYQTQKEALEAEAKRRAIEAKVKAQRVEQELQIWEDFAYEAQVLPEKELRPMKTVGDLHHHIQKDTRLSPFKKKLALSGLETAYDMDLPLSLIDRQAYLKTLKEKGLNLSKTKAKNYLSALNESIEAFTKDFFRTEGQEFTLGDLLSFMEFYTHTIPFEFSPRSIATRKQDTYVVKKAIHYFRADRPLLSAFNLAQSKFKQHLEDDSGMTKSSIATYVRGFKGSLFTFMVFYKFWENPQLLQPEVAEEAEPPEVEVSEEAGEALIESVKAAIVEQLQQVAFTAPEPPTTIEVEEVVPPEPSKLTQKLQLKGDRVFEYEVPETGLTSNEAMRIALRILTEVVDFDEKDLTRLQTVAGTVKTF